MILLLVLLDDIPADISHFRSQERYDQVKIALVGKYTDLHDSYMSVSKALEHSAFRAQRKLVILVNLTLLFYFRSTI